MKTLPKFFSFITSLFLGLFLAGCSQAPEEVDGKPVHVLEGTLVQPLEINTDKEQELYFRFKRQPDVDTDYLISAVAVMPSEYDYEKLGFLLNNKLVEDKRMSFELALTYYDKEGKATPIGLRQYLTYEHYKSGMSNGSVFTKQQFIGFNKFSFWYGIEENYSGRANGLAYFNTSKNDGYYRLSIRALQQYRDYPKMKLAVHIGPDIAK